MNNPSLFASLIRMTMDRDAGLRGPVIVVAMKSPRVLPMPDALPHVNTRSVFADLAVELGLREVSNS